MTFLNPFVLFGLVAAAIPVLLHLLNLRKLRTVEFSSVRFLMELQKTSMRRVRFRQILLLILRTLLVVAIVFAFSRPTLRGSLAGLGNSGASSTVIIILDDSPSTSVHDERGTAFARGAQTASRLIDIAGDGDRLYILPLSELGPGGPLPPPRSPESARGALARMTPSPVSVTLETALRTVRPLLAASTDANREVVFVSDGQATQLASNAGPADSSVELTAGGRLFLCSSPPLRLENSAVTGGEILTRIVTVKKPVRLHARISNSGSEPVRESVASVYCDGARVAQQSADIPPHGSIQPVFSFMAKRRGFLGGSVQIEDDAFDADNTWNFVLQVPEHIAVLLTGPDVPATQMTMPALTLGGDSALAGNISTHQITNADILSADLSRFDVIVMCGPGGLPPSAAQRVARFVSDGGGLIFFPGSDTRSFDGALFRALGLPAPSGPPATLPAGSFLSFSTVDYAHPLFEGLFDVKKGQGGKNAGIESPRITTALPLTAGEKGIRVIGLTSGGAFLVDYGTGRGRVLVFAVEAGTGWSDFPLKGLFAPLLHRGVAYAGIRSAQPPPISPGDPLRFSVRLRTFTDRDAYTITLPDGNSRKAVPEFQPSEGTALFNGGTAPEPGVYRLSRDSRGGGAPAEDIAAIAVNLSPGESDLRTATDEDIERFRRRGGIPPGAVHTAPPEGAVDTVRQARYGNELWKEFVALAVLLALAEMAVGRVPGAAPTGTEAA